MAKLIHIIHIIVKYILHKLELFMNNLLVIHLNKTYKL